MDDHLTAGAAVRQAIDVVYRRRDDALIVCGAVVAIALVYTYTATPTYEARAQILIETAAPTVVTFQEVLEQDRAADEYYQTQYRILQSRALARRTLDSADLWSHPHFNARHEAWYSPRRAWRGAQQWVGRLTGASALEVAAPRDSGFEAGRIDAFLAGLTIAPVRNSRLVDVRYLSPDPAFAALAANALARAYLEQSVDLRTSASQEASRMLDERLAEQKKTVEAAEQALQRYREEHDAISLQERQNIVVQRLEDLNAALTKARTGRIAKEAAYQQLQEIRRTSGSVDAVPAVMANGFIQQLKSELATLQREEAELSKTFLDKHPRIETVRTGIANAEAKLRAEIDRVLQSVQNEYVLAAREEQSFARALDAQKAEAQLLNRQAIDYGALERDAKANRDVFEKLVQRAKETGISGELRTNNVRIVDEAEVPRSPAYPNRGTHVLLGLSIGVAMALGFVFAAEGLDTRIKTIAEVKAALPLPYLGSLPIAAGAPAGLLVSGPVPRPFADAVRALQSNVEFASPGERRSVVVTSTIPGEGKTVVAANLAISLAMNGRRVLLVDADLRQPRQQQIFGTAPGPGLADLVARRAKPSQAIRTTMTERLWLLPAGEVSAAPAEVLGEAAFGDLLATLLDSFDWVILDSPPVTGMADASLLAHVAGGVLFVVGAEMTPRAAARAALDQLDRARATYVGVVLNRLDPDGHPYYYYPRT